MYKDTPIPFSNSMLRPLYRLQIHTFLHHLPQWTEKNAYKCINTYVHLELRIKNSTYLQVQSLANDNICGLQICSHSTCYNIYCF